jgi:hypothetical protein
VPKHTYTEAEIRYINDNYGTIFGPDEVARWFHLHRLYNRFFYTIILCLLQNILLHSSTLPTYLSGVEDVYENMSDISFRI